MTLNISNQNLSSIVVEGTVLKCYREDEFFQEHSLEKISKLVCSNNRLTNLPDNLPGGLKILQCSNNQLTSLPDTLPKGLEVLECYNNPLKHVPFFSKRPKYLSVPDKFKEKHSAKRYLETTQQISRSTIFSEMGFSEDFLELELGRD